ncbi:ROK family transcriptional regulator [Brevibacillus sp. 179-C 1.1 NHS]|uniref:ROK family transcriptional regulator n=1 Tax=Brevibacillus sp. 179-C 1.1 NHS TaxID=3235177 RepID=UPI0039A25159
MRRTGDLKLIQELNRSIILDTIRHYGPISRSEIAKRNKLSPTTVTSAVSELIRDSFVCEVGTGESNGGRKPILVQFSPDSRFLIGVSISGAKITIAEMNLEAAVKRKEVYSIKAYQGESFLAYLMDIMEQFLRGATSLDTCMGISIVTQGIVDSVNGVIRYNPKLRLQDAPVKEMIEQHFQLKAWLDNDSNAYLLAEKTIGDFSHYQNMLYVTIGDGLGASILMNGAIYRGFKGGAGEFGHTTIDRAGVRCDCGNVGCLENYVSWPTIYSKLISSLAKGKSSRISELVEQDVGRITPAVFRQALAEQDPLAVSILEETASYLASGLVNLIHLFNPEVIILGGEIAFENELLIAKVKEYVAEYAHDILAEDLEIRPNSLGENVEVAGAAAVLLQDTFQFSL